MKQQWTNLSKSIGEMHSNLDTFFAELTEKKYSKAIKILTDLWNKVIVLHNEFENLVEPVKSVDVKIPFTSLEFAEMWAFYKDYLTESHQTYMGSRHEVMMLRRLYKLSDKDEKKAIEMLELFMANGYKSIFKPTNKQITGEEPTKTEDKNNSSFDISVQSLDL